MMISRPATRSELIPDVDVKRSA